MEWALSIAVLTAKPKQQNRLTGSIDGAIIYGMKVQEVLALLEETARKLSIRLHYDDLKKGVVNTPGGSFVLRGEKHILLHKHLTLQEKVEVLAELLSEMDTDGIHLPPLVRQKIESARARHS